MSLKVTLRPLCAAQFRSSMEEVVPWDPTTDSASPGRHEEDRSWLTEAEREALERDKQRKTLYDIRERLQRAMIIGDRFNCIERIEDAVPGYEVAASGQGHRVLGDNTTEVLAASNPTTALLLSRQFEGISRKDVIVQELEERFHVMNVFHSGVRVLQAREAAAKLRACALQVETARAAESDLRSLLAARMTELEASCRRRTEQAAEELSSRLHLELSRALQLTMAGHAQSQRHWLAQQEERARHHVILEADRGLSRIFGQELSESQGLGVKKLLRDKVPLGATTLVDSHHPESKRHRDVARDAASAAAAKLTSGLPTHYSEAFARELAGTDGTDSDADLVPNEPLPVGYADSDVDSSAAPKGSTNPATFTPYWGWMFKSSGVLMTWQRRFFVFTARGKLKCSSSDKGPWMPLLSANNIARVEVDTYGEGSGGAAPPTSQYHKYGFYVDLHDTHNPNHGHNIRRLRFCCFSRKELNAWLTVLRRATDVIFALEESGAIARSPHRRRLDLGPEISRQAIESVMGGGRRVGDGDHSPPTYRRRTQLEEDQLALEFRKAQLEREDEDRRARAIDVSLQHPLGHYNSPSMTFGPPPIPGSESLSSGPKPVPKPGAKTAVRGRRSASGQ